MFDLSGRRAVVTGASRGIGQATAVALAQAGADVASIHLADPEGAAETTAAIEATGRRALLVDGTTADAAQVEAFADRVERELGPIDVWVNNAARIMVRGFGRRFIPVRICTPFTIPRSPTGKTSGRCKQNIRNISADQRPNPLITVISATISSSDLCVRPWRSRRPSITCEERSRR